MGREMSLAETSWPNAYSRKNAMLFTYSPTKSEAPVSRPTEAAVPVHVTLYIPVIGSPLYDHPLPRLAMSHPAGPVSAISIFVNCLPVGAVKVKPPDSIALKLMPLLYPLYHMAEIMSALALSVMPSFV